MDSDEPRAQQRSSGFDAALTGGRSPPGVGWVGWINWRWRLLAALALAGCFGVFTLARGLAEAPQLDAAGTLALQRLEAGHASVTLLPGDAALLQQSPRWLKDDAQRARQRALQQPLARVLGGPAGSPVKLSFFDGREATQTLQPRGLAGLGASFWLLAALALVLYLVTMVVLLARPSPRNVLYAAMALSQTGSLLCIAVESVPSLGLPLVFAQGALAWRMGFDLVTAAAIVHSAAVHPRRLPGWRGWVGGAWGTAALLGFGAGFGLLPQLWWWTQLGVLALGSTAIALLAWSHRLEPHPFALVLQRFGALTVGSWGLITLALALASPEMQQRVAASGTVIWTVFLASLLLMVPFLSTSQQLLREFSLLALTSSVATALDLMFVAIFSFGPFASLTLSLFIALGLYAGARQWVLNRLLGTRMLTTERMFEQLYRIAREVEAHPERTAVLLMQLVKDLFEPIEASVVARDTPQARVLSDGSTLLLPVPVLAGPGTGTGEAAPPAAILLRFARRGRRLFTSDDARLADRIVEQLRRAVAFDRAVEQGRSEERLRLAQDLHDDIGARLLTLMYKAPSPEMEDYVRHTLQDLKTLTRGLAAANHRLSHAAGEWKADLSQRLTAAHIALVWQLHHDDDLLLSVVQWSGLTRVLRELVSNVIAHAQAERVEVRIDLSGDTLTLRVADDGVGGDPQGWSHGLGIGGIRKRVKQLGGELEWRRRQPRGIACQVVIRAFSAQGQA